MFKKIAFITALFAFTTPANAGYQSWTANVDKNPFSGGVVVNVLYTISDRAQVSLRCDTAKNGVVLTVIPGWEMVPEVEGFKPEIKIAVDGEVILQRLFGEISSYGENLAGAQVTLTKSNADKLTEYFLIAKRQIAIEDGMSTKPFLMTAKGSTATAKKLKQCYEAQKGDVAEPVSDDETNKEDRIAEIKLEIESLRQELLELQGNE